MSSASQDAAHGVFRMPSEVGHQNSKRGAQRNTARRGDSENHLRTLRSDTMAAAEAAVEEHLARRGPDGVGDFRMEEAERNAFMEGFNAGGRFAMENAAAAGKILLEGILNAREEGAAK